MRASLAVLILAVPSMPASAAPAAPYLRAPAVNEYARHDPAGTTVIPSGRFLRPAGRHLPVARWPHGLVLSPDGRMAFVASEGVGQLIADWDGPSPTVAELVPEPAAQPGKRANAGGACFSPDGARLYWSGGDSGTVYVFDTRTRARLAEVALNVPVGGRPYADSFAIDLQASADGRSVYCADVTNFRVAVIDTARQAVVGSVRVGRYPYALAVVGRRVFVANIGMFEYSPIPPPDPDAPKTTGPGRLPVPDPRGLTFPPYGFPSREAREGVRREGRNIPGLGDPNVPESFSVWTLDVSSPARPRVVARLKTGLLVGAPSDRGKTVGGSAPNFVVARGQRLWVSNNNNDMLERVDTRTNRIVRTERIRPSPLTARLRGVGPVGMALSPDGRRLYVAECGINAIAVVDAATLRVLGHIPTAWYPYRVAVSNDGKRLLTICFKGFGNGPNAGANRPQNPYLGMRGVFSVIPVPSAAELARHSHTVRLCNGMVDRAAERKALSSPVVPTLPGVRSEQIRYVVFITKENHTFDTVFDRVPGTRNDPSLLRWGLHQTISAPNQPTLNDVAVMVNHNALAREFALSDNFYMEPEASGVGHRWLIGVQPNNFCQMLYTLGWDFKLHSTAPGRRASFGSNGSIQPEDYLEAGAMWENLARNGVSFRNYGEGFEFAGVDEGESEHRTGAREVVNLPMPKVVYDNTCREFPIFNMNIPDQYRAHWFEQDVRERFLSGRHPMPRFLNVAICNDHGTRPDPERGYPYMASWMADNDLALGRMVEFLSHTPYWRNMAIFVTEDDAGGEPDHIDAQRSVMLVISPWAKRGYVSHRHTTIVSMHRTLYSVFGLPPLNMFDALANDLSDCFTTKPDFRPYVCKPVDPRIFDPEKAKIPGDPDYLSVRSTPNLARDAREDEDFLLRLGAEGSRPAR